MATLAELQDALINADKEGDTAAARQLADAIHAMRQPAQQPPSRMERIGKGMRDPIEGGAQLLTKMLPEGVVSAGNRLNNWLADNTGLVGKLPEGGVDQQVREAEADYQSRMGDSGFDGYRMLGNIASPANVAAFSRLPMAATTAGRAAVGAAGGAMSGALAPVQSGDFAEQKLKQIGLGGATGAAMAPVMSGLARVVSPNAAKNPDLALLQSAGVKPTIGQTLGGRANAFEEKLMSVPIVGDAISSARGKALQQFNAAAINRATSPIGAKVSETGQSGVAKAGDLLSDAYESAISKAKVVRFDQQFAQDLTQLQGMTRNLVPAMRSRFDKTLKDILGTRVTTSGSMIGSTYKKVDSELGQVASRYRGSQVASEAEFGDAVAQLQNLMRQQMMRSNPQVAEALKKADAGWANLVRVEGAAKAAKNTDGLFTPGQLNIAIQTADKSTRKRAVSRGEALMQDLGKAGQSVLGNKVPNSGTADRLLYGGGAALGGYMVDPLVPLGLVGGAGLYSSPMQSMLRGAATVRPGFADPVAEALRKSSTGLLFPAAQVSAGLLN